MLKLIVREGILSQREFSLKEGDNFLGRDPASDIVLDSKGISRRHAKIVKRGANLKITDLESSNGTFVNGVQVQEKELHSGDIISFANIALEISMSFITPQIPEVQQKGFLNQFKKFSEENIVPFIDKVFKNFSLPAVYVFLFLCFLILNVFFTLGPVVSESQKFMKGETVKRGVFLVNRLADLNENAIRKNDPTRMDVSMIEELEGVYVASLIKPFVDENGELRAEVLAPVHRAMAIDVQEAWQKKSLGRVKKIKDSGGATKNLIAFDDEIFSHEIEQQRMIFSKPVFDTVEGEQTVVALAQVVLGVPGLKMSETSYWIMFMKAFLAALFLGFIFAFLIHKLTEHHLGLLYGEISDVTETSGRMVTSPVRYGAIQKIVNGINQALETVRVHTAKTPDTVTRDIYDKEKMEAILQISDEGIGIFDFSNKVVASNTLFESFLMIGEGQSRARNIGDVMQDKTLLNGILDLLKKRGKSKM